MVRIHQGALLEIKPFEGVWTTSVRILLSKPRAPWRPLKESAGHAPLAGVERRLLDRLGAAGAINFAAIGETRQEGQASATDAPRLGRCNDHARPLRALSTACQIGEEANYHPFRRTGSGPRHLARTQKGFALRWQARTAKPPIRIACGCCWSAGSPAGLGCINCKACLIWAQD